MRVYDSSDCSGELLQILEFDTSINSQNIIPNGGVIGTYSYDIETIDRFGRHKLSSCQSADVN
jgi:hypothetical protein